jgi:hypothetical protein
MVTKLFLVIAMLLITKCLAQVLQTVASLAGEHTSTDFKLTPGALAIVSLKVPGSQI